MGSLKSDERITKTAEEASVAEATAPAKNGRSWLKWMLLLLIVGAAIAYAYNYYKLHRPTSEAEIVEIESLITAGKEEEARALMIGAQVRSKDVSALRLRVGRAYLREGRVGPATALLSQVGDALIKEERLAIAEYFLVAGDPFSAVKFFESAINAGMPRTASLLARYGEALALSANGDAAIKIFQESLALDGTKTRVRVHLALTLANMGRLDESKVETLLVLKAEPDNEKALSLIKALGASR
jgi:tetratricopeptide (TPR) repeat protein